MDRGDWQLPFPIQLITSWTSDCEGLCRQGPCHPATPAPALAQGRGYGAEGLHTVRSLDEAGEESCVLELVKLQSMIQPYKAYPCACM